MLVITIISVLALVGLVVFFAFRRLKLMQRLQSNLRIPVAEMQEQIEITASSAVERLDEKIAEIEVLLAELDRRSRLVAQQIELEQQLHGQIQKQQMQLQKLIQQEVADLNQKQIAIQQSIETCQNLSTSTSMTGKSDTNTQQPLAIETPISQPSSRIGKSVNKRAWVLELAEQGVEIADIAKQTGMGKGEVSLILKLKKKLV